jgi:hypothetical protein
MAGKGEAISASLNHLISGVRNTVKGVPKAAVTGMKYAGGVVVSSLSVDYLANLLAEMDIEIIGEGGQSFVDGVAQHDVTTTDYIISTLITTATFALGSKVKGLNFNKKSGKIVVKGEANTQTSLALVRSGNKFMIPVLNPVKRFSIPKAVLAGGAISGIGYGIFELASELLNKSFTAKVNRIVRDYSDDSESHENKFTNVISCIANPLLKLERDFLHVKSVSDSDLSLMERLVQVCSDSNVQASFPRAKKFAHNDFDVLTHDTSKCGSPLFLFDDKWLPLSGIYSEVNEFFTNDSFKILATNKFLRNGLSLLDSEGLSSQLVSNGHKFFSQCEKMDDVLNDLSSMTNLLTSGYEVGGEQDNWLKKILNNKSDVPIMDTLSKIVKNIEQMNLLLRLA